MKRWALFAKERFHPGAHLPMVLLFTGANALFAAHTLTSPSWSWPRFLAVFVLILSFFFRLRVFDEIKDHETDLVVNPSRPLARGLLSLAEAKKGLLALILLETAIAAALGTDALLVHGLALAYSLLMYEEFFLSDFLRPRLTTYAVSHTFVSVLAGLSAATAMTGSLPSNLLWFFGMNWFFFNLFEFARKTFSPEEERVTGEGRTVESYSSLFGVRGAVALSLSQAFAGSCFFPATLPAALVYAFLAGGPFLVKPSSRARALWFRNVTGLYLLIHYALVIVLLLFPPPEVF